MPRFHDAAPGLRTITRFSITDCTQIGYSGCRSFGLCCSWIQCSVAIFLCQGGYAHNNGAVLQQQARGTSAQKRGASSHLSTAESLSSARLALSLANQSHTRPALSSSMVTPSCSAITLNRLREEICMRTAKQPHDASWFMR